MSTDVLERMPLQETVFPKPEEFADVVERLLEPPEATREERRRQAIETLLEKKDTTVAHQIQGVLSFYGGRRVGATDYTSHDTREFTAVVTRGEAGNTVREAYSAYAICGSEQARWTETYYIADMFSDEGRTTRVVAEPTGREGSYAIRAYIHKDGEFQSVTDDEEADVVVRDFFERSLYAAEQHFSGTDDEQQEADASALSLAKRYFHLDRPETSLE